MMIFFQASKEIKEKENDMVGEKSTTESLTGDSHLDGASTVPNLSYRSFTVVMFF